MGNVLAKILPKGLGLPKRLPELDLEFKDLEAQRVEMDQRIEALKETLNGEDDWMLCLTKRKEACEEPTDD